jgi:hypothetical protein
LKILPLPWWERIEVRGYGFNESPPPSPFPHPEGGDIVIFSWFMSDEPVM